MITGTEQKLLSPPPGQDRQEGGTADLDQLQLLRLLKEAGIVVDPGGIEILFERSARHRCTLVRDVRGSAWFIKRKGGAEDVHGPSLAREIAFNSEFLMGDSAREISPHAPRYAGHDSDRVLVVEGFCDRRALGDALFEYDMDSSVFRRLGGFLASLHEVPVGDPAATGVKNNPSPLLTHGHVTPAQLVNRPSAFAELLRLLQRAPSLNRRLRALRQAWSPVRLVHGDFKVDNILILEGDRRAAGFRVVDWEAFGIGDPDWDCAALIGSLYYLWVVHCFSSDEPGQLSERDVTRHVAAFLAGYEERAGTALDQTRILAWAGYWITHKVIGRLMPSSPLSAHDLAAMHLAEQLLENEPLPGNSPVPA